MDLWGYISGKDASSPRTEVLHEAHKHNSTDGNGNALRVGDWKVVLRTGGQWATGTRMGSNDGWFGGPGSSDNVTGAYVLPKGATTQNWTVSCPRPPRDIVSSYPCEKKKGEGADAPEFACLFNIKEDPCELIDMSSTHPEKLHELMTRLDVYRATSTTTSAATPNPDGPTCPDDRTVPDTLCPPAGRSGPVFCTVKSPCNHAAQR